MWLFYANEVEETAIEKEGTSIPSRDKVAMQRGVAVDQRDGISLTHFSAILFLAQEPGARFNDLLIGVGKCWNTGKGVASRVQVFAKLHHDDGAIEECGNVNNLICSCVV